MGFYSCRIRPWCLDKLTASPETEGLRKEVLAPARGRLLEIGFGTGLNIPHFPPEVTDVVGLEPNPGVERLARPRIDAASIPIELRIGAGERLPFPDHSFDTVVTTLVLCSVQDVGATLQEIRRVLAPGGQYLLMEHGLAPEPEVQRWQHRMNGFNKLVFGCLLTRPMRETLLANGCRFERSREFYREKDPRFVGYTTLGVAVPVRDSA